MRLRRGVGQPVKRILYGELVNKIVYLLFGQSSASLPISPDASSYMARMRLVKAPSFSMSFSLSSLASLRVSSWVRIRCLSSLTRGISPKRLRVRP